MLNIARLKLLTLPFLLTAQLCYSLPDPQAPDSRDSVKIPISAVYYYNSVADSLDACKEGHETLLMAIDQAKKTILLRDKAIDNLTKTNDMWLEFGAINDRIIESYKVEVKEEKKKGLLKLVGGVGLGIIAGAAIISIAK